jgi:predicted TIM-barrel fold metal-dependent hydrolase
MSSETTGRRPALVAPPGACDCHLHIFGSRQRFPLAADLTYTPTEAPVEAYRAVRRRLNLERTVVIQPSAYGTDNACTLEAVAELLPNARGVAVVDPVIPDRGLEHLHEAGIRGLRFSLTVKNAMRPGHLEAMARRIRPLGWHIQFRSTDRDLPEVESLLRKLPVDVCLDHLWGASRRRPLSAILPGRPCSAFLPGDTAGSSSPPPTSSPGCPAPAMPITPSRSARS